MLSSLLLLSENHEAGYIDRHFGSGHLSALLEHTWCSLEAAGEAAAIMQLRDRGKERERVSSICNKGTHISAYF